MEGGEGLVALGGGGAYTVVSSDTVVSGDAESASEGADPFPLIVGLEPAFPSARRLSSLPVFGEGGVGLFGSV